MNTSENDIYASFKARTDRMRVFRNVVDRAFECQQKINTGEKCFIPLVNSRGLHYSKAATQSMVSSYWNIAFDLLRDFQPKPSIYRTAKIYLKEKTSQRLDHSAKKIQHETIYREEEICSFADFQRMWGSKL